MTTPADLQATVAAAQLAQAQADYAVLSALKGQMDAASMTLDQFEAALTGSTASISNPQTVKQVSDLAATFQSLRAQYASIVATVQAQSGE